VHRIIQQDPDDDAVPLAPLDDVYVNDPPIPGVPFSFSTLTPTSPLPAGAVTVSSVPAALTWTRVPA
jgi:hypothetical protein